MFLLAIRREYLMAAHPPPLIIGFIRPASHEQRSTGLLNPCSHSLIARASTGPSLEQCGSSGTIIGVIVRHSGASSIESKQYGKLKLVGTLPLDRPSQRG
jgi:hypothetical protein